MGERRRDIVAAEGFTVPAALFLGTSRDKKVQFAAATLLYTRRHLRRSRQLSAFGSQRHHNGRTSVNRARDTRWHR
jgi:hypothetical protein